MSKTQRLDPLFSPIPTLDSDHRAAVQSCAFTAATSADARRWQRRARPALADCLGFLDQKRVALRPKTVEQVDRGSYLRRKVILHASPTSTLPVYVLIPHRIPRPLPVVLALHGHGYGVKDIVGLWEDGCERLTPSGYHKDFACALAERGFLVVAPEISCFGERQADYSHLGSTPGLTPTTCHNAATYAMMLGKSAAGFRAFDAMRVLDYVQTLREADADRIGVMGISGGGMHTFFSAALDTRIKAAVISGYFCDWSRSILAINHCTCNFVPGLLRLGELSDLAGLIAPRPCLIENATRDEIFPIDAVKRTVTRARKAWRVFGSPDLLQTDFFEGRHEIHGTRAYDFLAQHLGCDEARDDAF